MFCSKVIVTLSLQKQKPLIQIFYKSCCLQNLYPRFQINGHISTYESLLATLWEQALNSVLRYTIHLQVSGLGEETNEKKMGQNHS